MSVDGVTCCHRLSIFECVNLVSLRSKHGGEHLAHGLVVLDHHHMGCHGEKYSGEPLPKAEQNLRFP